VVGEIFPTCPDRTSGPASLLYNGYQVSFPEVKLPGRGVDHSPTSSAEVKEKVEVYLYSPLWASVACYKVTFTFTFNGSDMPQSSLILGFRLSYVNSLTSRPPYSREWATIAPWSGGFVGLKFL